MPLSLPCRTAANIPRPVPETPWAIRPQTSPQTLTILAAASLSRGLVVCFAIARFPRSWLYGRGIELGTLAQSLAAGQGLSSPFGGVTGPTALLAPGYPAVVALLFRVFGSFTFRAAIAVMVVQILFSVVTVLLIMRVATSCFSVRAANLAGVFWALSLPLLWMPTIFWETCLSALLMVGLITLALHCERRPATLTWACIGTYCGFAALVNPALLPSSLAIMAWAAWPTRRTSRYPPLLGLLMLLVVFAPWPIRNARVLHAFIPLRSTIGFELWIGNHPGATGYLDESQFPIFSRVEYGRYVSQGEVAYMREKWALGQAYIDAHPRRFLALSALRFVRFWSGTGSHDGSVVFVLHAALTTSLGLLGLVRLFAARRSRLALLFLLPLILFPVPYYLTHAEFRYRLVVDPLLTILAAYPVSAFAGRRKTW